MVFYLYFVFFYFIYLFCFILFHFTLFLFYKKAFDWNNAQAIGHSQGLGSYSVNGYIRIYPQIQGKQIYIIIYFGLFH
jgi:hypothetical protein